MSIGEFIQNNDVEYTHNIVDENTIGLIEKELKILFGDELKQYIMKYGYLSYRHIEFYGINSIQMIDSDMIKQTSYLHMYFPKTEGYIALGNYGDGEYVIVSSDDMVYEYDSEMDTIRETKKKLFDYILEVFIGIDA